MPSPRSHRRLSEEALVLVAARFRVLSEPIRLKLIIALEDGEQNVSQLVETTGNTQTNVSRQLQILAEAGILSRRKAGVSVFYQIADPAIFDLCRHVCGGLERDFRRKGEASKLFAL
jgi:DNA-binding transcriptional ArsR family regulator